MMFPTLFDSSGRVITLVTDNQKNLVGYVRQAFPTKTDSEMESMWDGFHVGSFRNKMVASFQSKEAAMAAVLQEKMRRLLDSQ